MKTTTFENGQVLTNVADVLAAMETHKVKKTPNGVFNMYFENGKLIGESLSGTKSEKARDITYFSQNAFIVVEPIKPILKAGDKAVVTEAQHGTKYNVGDVVEVVRIREDETFDHQVKSEKGSATLPKWRLRPATEEEIAAYESTIVREGDYAVIVANDCISLNAQVGDIVKVQQDDGSVDVPFNVTNETEGSNKKFWIYRRQARKATEKEIAEFHASKLKEGDVAVIVDETTFLTFKKGDLVEISEVRPSEKVRFEIRKPDGYTGGAYVTDLRPATEIEAKDFKVKKAIKVGYIKLTKKDATASHHGTPSFEIGMILEAKATTVYDRSLRANKIGESLTQTIRVEDFEIPTAAEIEEAKKPKFKEGDYVANIGGSSYFDMGEILIITVVNGKDHYDVKSLEGKTGGKQAKNIRKATEKEIAEAKAKAAERAERKVFEDLGRRYGQLKKGDIVRVMDTCMGRLSVGDIGEVVDNTKGSVDDKDYGARVNVGGRPNLSNNAIVKLVVAVENRKDK
ncbi:Uncharacterized protein BCRIVMBC845_06447 [Bacillus cereus]|nr:Uncharacterized protein BCRIVMBC845_06447 [Bacillus cereus]